MFCLSLPPRVDYNKSSKTCEPQEKAHIANSETTIMGRSVHFSSDKKCDKVIQVKQYAKNPANAEKEKCSNESLNHVTITASQGSTSPPPIAPRPTRRGG